LAGATCFTSVRSAIAGASRISQCIDTPPGRHRIVSDVPTSESEVSSSDELSALEAFLATGAAVDATLVP